MVALAQQVTLQKVAQVVVAVELPIKRVRLVVMVVMVVKMAVVAAAAVLE
jgi:hypothetical protein